MAIKRILKINYSWPELFKFQNSFISFQSKTEIVKMICSVIVLEAVDNRSKCAYTVQPDLDVHSPQKCIEWRTVV